jgi:hypothetical protein
MGVLAEAHERFHDIRVPMYFELASEIVGVETIAVGRAIRDLTRLRKRYGPGRWRKLKGTALVRLQGGRVRMKIKRFLD